MTIPDSEFLLSLWQMQHMARRKSIQLHLPATVTVPLGNCNKSSTDDIVTFPTSFRFWPRQVWARRGRGLGRGKGKLGY